MSSIETTAIFVILAIMNVVFWVSLIVIFMGLTDHDTRIQSLEERSKLIPDGPPANGREKAAEYLRIEDETVAAREYFLKHWTPLKGSLIIWS